MVPKVVLPPIVPFTSQLTTVFVLPVTLALNCLVCPTCTLALVGEIVTEVTEAEDRGTILTSALAESSVFRFQ